MSSGNLIFNFTSFCVKLSFFNKLLALGILFSATVRSVVVAKLVTLVILFLTLFFLALTTVVVAKLVILGISYLTRFILALRAVV